MKNPLLSSDLLPAFSDIQPDHVEPAIIAQLRDSRAQVESILADDGPRTWDNLAAPIEALRHRLDKVWSPVSHLNGVCNSERLREKYNTCLPLLTRYQTEMTQSEPLYEAYRELAQQIESNAYPDRHRVVSNTLRDFRLAGVALSGPKKARYAEIVDTLASLSAKYDENVMDAGNAWRCHITNASRIAGLPAQTVEYAAELARKENKTGWLFLLDHPTFYAVATHADNEDLRREFHTAWVTRASDQGPHAGRWDNSEVMEDILRLRHEMAQLVGFENYAEYSLATKMATDVDEVLDFLESLAAASRAKAQLEFEALEALAGRALAPWDVAFFSEKLRRERFGVSDEELRPYFPVPKVLEGMFEVARRLYGIRITEISGVDTWHKDVLLFRVLNEDGSARGSFYADLHARSKKRGGAWMDECVGRMQIGETSSQPVAYLVCNFPAPASGRPALVTHQDVVTLFHEFGHTLHHLMTEVNYPSIAGINGVPWDAVELPSQFMENFAWEAETLPLISSHIDTGKPLPTDLFERLRGSRTFQAAMQMIRQLEFALFDFRLHANYDPKTGSRISQTLDAVRREIAVVPVSEFNRFQHSFSHIFSGGYAAGYYSYKWAEVLAADAYSAFSESSVFDRQTADEFLTAILSRGGGRDVMEAFVDFRGRKPRLEPLLRQSGLEQKTPQQSNGV